MSVILVWVEMFMWGFQEPIFLINTCYLGIFLGKARNIALALYNSIFECKQT